MLRWMVPVAVASFAAGFAFAADMPRTGIAVDGKAPLAHARRGFFKQESGLLFTPSDRFPSVRIPPSTPLLPGSSALPGYYGSSHSYEYQGPYYGGPNLSYWHRLPYACGVYGYC